MPVAGLDVVADFVSPELEAEIDRWFGPTPPQGDADRHRVVRYGTGVPATGYTSGVTWDTIPPILGELAKRVVEAGRMTQTSNAITVNEYLTGQGIRFHVDKQIAGSRIVALGLVGDAMMGMRCKATKETREVWFPRRALVVMTGESRYDWQHCIYPVPARRLSIVFRYG